MQIVWRHLAEAGIEASVAVHDVKVSGAAAPRLKKDSSARQEEKAEKKAGE